MSGLSQGLPGRIDSSNGESSRGESSKGDSWLRSIKGKNVGRHFFSLYREPSYDGSESEAAFEMKPLTPQKGDEEKTDVKGKKVDKGKAVYKDPWVNQDGKQGDVEPSKFANHTSRLLEANAR